jgi:hypothetical protein
VANGKVFVVTDDGALYCLDPGAPDDTPPLAYNLAPARAAAMSGSPPIKMSAALFDLGCGIDQSSIQLTLDGNAVQHQFDAVASTVSYATSEKSVPKTLPDGRHELVLRAKDWRGNALSETWGFIVDNKLRPPTPSRGEGPPKSASGAGPTYSAAPKAPLQPAPPMEVEIPPPPPPPPAPGPSGPAPPGP